MTAAVQFTGLASGIDTKAIIDAIIAAEGRPLNQLKQRLSEVQARRTALNTIKTKLVTTQQKIANLTLTGNVNTKAATPTDKNILTATANASAANGTLTVNVKQLATPTVATSLGPIGSDLDDTVGLTVAGFATTPTNGTFTINGKTVSIGDVTTATLDDVRDAINDVTGAAHGTVTGQVGGLGVTAAIVSVNGREQLQLTATGGTAVQLGSAADDSNFLAMTKLLAAEPTTTKTGSGAGVLDVGDTTASGNTTVSDIDVSGADRSDTYTFSFDGTNQLTLTRAGKSQTITLSAVAPGQTQTLDFDQLGIKLTLASIGATGDSTTTIGNFLNTQTITTQETLKSQSNLGTASPAVALSSANLAVSPGASGSFAINATGTPVTITWTNTDTLNDIINRVNASAAGVVAAYDATRDVVTITSKTTGSSLMSLMESAPGLLAALNLTGAGVQTAGENAVISVNGGADFSSTSNTVAGAVSNVTFSLKTTGSTQVTVAQDADTTIRGVNEFITAYNSALDLIRDDTNYDPITKTAAILFGDLTADLLKHRLRTVVASRFTGATSTDRFQSLMDLGISFGAVGSAVGTTNDLVLDEKKLRNALSTDPDAVENAFKAFSTSARLTSAGDIIGASGSPTDTGHDSGDFLISSDGTANLTATFTPLGGTAQSPTSGTIAAGGTNTTLIPGVTLTAAGSLTSASSTVHVDVTLGVAQSVNDYLKQILGLSGVFKAADNAADSNIRRLNKDIADFQERLDGERLGLEQKFSAMESAISLLQQQGQALTQQLASLSRTSSSSAR